MATIAMGVVTLFLITAPAFATDTPPIRHQPELLFDISDEEMSMPLGVVSDVAVAGGLVYILDSSRCNVRRVSLAGELHSPMGRPGTGPGDLNWPLRLTASSDGECIVIQQFSRQSPCFDSNGDACAAFDISAFRKGYASAIYLRVAYGNDRQLIVAGTTNDRKATSPNATFEELGTSAAVRRLHRERLRSEDLFVTNADGADSNAVFIPGNNLRYVIFGWDINSRGEIIYADPAGDYRVLIGHPADGDVRTIDLPVQAGDDQKIQELANLIGGDIRAEELPRIGAVYWLDDEFFMVMPSAGAAPPTAGKVRTFEVSGQDGSSYGRFNIDCEYDPGNDEIFIRNDILIIVRGGKSVARSTFGEFLPQDEEGDLPTEVYEIRIQAYRLFASLRGNS